MSWYYEQGGKRQGPVSSEELQQLHTAGTVADNTLVWRAGMSDWQPYGRATGQAASQPEDQAAGETAAEATGEATAGATSQAMAAPDNCSQCGRTFSPVELITLSGQQVCAECKPVFLQRMKEGTILPGRLEYAGFWIRFGARVVDGLILYAVSMVMTLPVIFLMGNMQQVGNEPDPLLAVTGCLLPILQLGVAVAYEAWFLGRFGATPGKMLCKLRVVLSDGTPISYGRGAGRHFATYLSGMILLIGYLMAAWDDEKRALHDHICNTRVVRV